MYKQDRCGCQCQKYAMAEVPMQQFYFMMFMIER